MYGAMPYACRRSEWLQPTVILPCMHIGLKNAADFFRKGTVHFSPVLDEFHEDSFVQGILFVQDQSHPFFPIQGCRQTLAAVVSKTIDYFRHRSGSRNRELTRYQ